jgi:hypothetical protein
MFDFNIEVKEFPFLALILAEYLPQEGGKLLIRLAGRSFLSDWMASSWLVLKEDTKESKDRVPKVKYWLYCPPSYHNLYIQNEINGGTMMLDANVNHDVVDVINYIKTVKRLNEAGILVQASGNMRERTFAYKEYHDILREGM